MTSLTLLRQASPLSQANEQVKILQQTSGIPEFGDVLVQSQRAPLLARTPDILQVNVGKLCNQTCQHCHVDAGPDRKEVMDRETAEQCVRVLENEPFSTLDVTGGAPEMCPQFKWLVARGHGLGKRVIDRCNLTILLAKGYETLAAFLADHAVEIVASLPCYLEENTDAQRGTGVFVKSIKALQLLNSMGFGIPGGSLKLTLVYNPVGPALPPDQPKLEQAYREQLRDRYGIEFSELYTITNMPISRFLDDLLSTGRFGDYMQRLREAYNPATVDGLMCRNTLSVGWDGALYDCDFNQMLDLKTRVGGPQHIRDFRLDALINRRIVTGQHCYGCTAGAGSGCQGAIS